MPKQIYINLPVKNLMASKQFFTALGYNLNPEYSNDDAACMIVNESICIMLLTEPFFSTFTTKTICDAHTSTEVLLCLSCDSREEVDALIEKAVEAGAMLPRPTQDYGFMYGRAFEDIDGHIWELVYMEPNAKSAG